MRRYVCPPWYECICPRGRIVSFTTMWNHRRAANRRRAAHGRGLFRYGPRVPEHANEYYFATNESLLDHQTEDEATATACFGRRRNKVQKRDLIGRELDFTSDHEQVNNRNHNDDVQFSKNALESCRSSTSPPKSSKDKDEAQKYVLHPSRQHSLDLQSRDSCKSHSTDNIALNCTDDHVHQQNYQDIPMFDARNSTVPSERIHPFQVYTNSRNDDPNNIQANSECDQIQAQRQPPFFQPSSTHINEHGGQSQTSSLEEDIMNQQENQETSSIFAEQPQLEHACRIPGMWEWINDNEGLVEIFFKHGLEYTVMDDLLQYSQAPCKTWTAVVDAIHRFSGLKEHLVVTPICPGHMAFIDWDTSDQYQNDCLQCNSPRPSSLKEAKGSITYIPIIPRIKAMVADEQSCRELYSYRHDEYLSPETINDVFDGTAYDDICNQYGGEDQVKYDVFIGASMDGFQVFKKTDHEVWSLAALNLNLPPHKRYLPRNILALSFFPGPNQPKNIQSYLVPFLKELQQSSEDGGTKMSFYDGTQRKVRIHLLYFSGDQPAVSKAAGLAGHNGRYPCRNCNIRGQYIGHYYYPSKMVVSSNGEFRLDHYFSPRALPLRTETESRLFVSQIENLTGSQKISIQRNSGIMERSMMCCLPTMHEYNSFVHDIMHTFMNIMKELLRIMIHSDIEDGFSLTPGQVEQFDREIESWRGDICKQISDPPPLVSKFTRWKAAECKTFALSFMLILFDGMLDEIYLNGLSKLATIVDIASRPVLTKSDITELRYTCIEFFEHYEREYFKYDQNRANLCKSIFHVLLHLADCTEYMGPLCNVSQFWMERYVGWIGDRLNARTRPAESMIKSCLYYESYKMAFRKSVHSKVSDFDNVNETDGFVLLGPSDYSNLDSNTRVGKHRRRLLRTYLRRKYCTISNEKVRTVVDLITEVKLYSRIKFVVGSDVVSAGVFYKIGSDQLRKAEGRADYYVAVEMDHTENSCDVYYGRVLELMEFYIPAGNLEEVEEHGSHHRVAILDWGKRLKIGAQAQVYKIGTIPQVFTAATMEDVEGIARLISVVQHDIPWKSREGTQTRSYFVDEYARVDHLLTNQKSYDGYNRKLVDFGI